MSYTCLLERGEEFSAECFSDIEPFVRSRLSLTAEKSCCNASGTESCPGFRSGTMCEPSTAGRGAGSSMSCAAGFPARTSALPGKARESTANGPDFGRKWRESLARYDPGSRSWKTRQCLLLGGLEEFSETFPKWGSMRDGELFRQPTPVLRTCGSGSGYWPTPLTQDAKHSGYAKSGPGQADKLSYAVVRWPTPTKSDGMGGPGTSGRKGGLNLRTAVKSPTRRIPTPTKDDATNSLLPISQIKRNSIPGMCLREGELPGGSLNPTWVEWLMGWPIEWTALRPLEMARFRQWRHSHGEFWRG